MQGNLMKTKKLITESLVKKVAGLAQLPLTPQEVSKFKPQLERILEYVEQVGQMETKGVKETSQVAGITNKLREDVVTKDRMFTQKEALSQTKRTHKGYFVVKAIFE